MSSISQHYSLPARTKARRLRIPDADRAGAVPVMGPANRAPGASIMGAPSQPVDVMGGADAGPRPSVMGPGDRSPRVDLLGESDLTFVDSLFTSVRGER